MTLRKEDVGPDGKYKLPPYLDATTPKGGSLEKENYLYLVESEVETAVFPPGKDMAVFGVGSGDESERAAKILKQKYGEGGPRLLSVDYSPLVLARLISNAETDPDYAKVIEGRMLLDIMKLDEEIAPESLWLVTMSSIMHELKSHGGWESMIKGFRQAVKATAKSGTILVRDFSPPEFQACQFELKTPLARQFFSLFEQFYHPRHRSRWSTVKEYEKNGNTIIGNSLWAFEVRTHFRMLFNDYYRKFGDKMLREEFFLQWHEPEESYVLITQEHRSIPEVLSALKTEVCDLGLLTSNLRFTDDSASDRILAEHMPWNLSVPSQRFIATFKKGEAS